MERNLFFFKKKKLVDAPVKKTFLKVFVDKTISNFK